MADPERKQTNRGEKAGIRPPAGLVPVAPEPLAPGLLGQSVPLGFELTAQHQ
jgi:hypothetical protein